MPVDPVRLGQLRRMEEEQLLWGGQEFLERLRRWATPDAQLEARDIAIERGQPGWPNVPDAPHQGRGMIRTVEDGPTVKTKSTDIEL